MTDYSELVKALRETATFTKFDDLLSKREQKLESLAFDAAAAIEELQQIADHYEQTAKDYWKEACEYKAQLPKRGEWINHKDEHQCSVCRETVVVDEIRWEQIGAYDYCPNCGAKMEGQE